MSNEITMPRTTPREHLELAQQWLSQAAYMWKSTGKEQLDVINMALQFAAVHASLAKFRGFD
jgi:hypothetical protein